MSLLFTVLVVLVLGAIAVVAAGHGDAMAEEDIDRLGTGLPDGPVSGEQLRRVRFSTALRGYRADEVDALVERLARQLDGQPDGQPDGQLDGQPDGREGRVADPARRPYQSPPEVAD